MCYSCFDAIIPSKEIGLSGVDAFGEIYDKDLGGSYSSLREKRSLMRKRGIAYADDFKQNREIGKEAAFKFGPQGNRKLSKKVWI
jgi:hypothetical protein